MSRYLGPRLRITRRLGHLSGLTRKKPSFKPVNPVNPFGPRKIIPPGQHGRNKSFKKKPYESCEYDYLIRLKLKQRLRFHYGLTEKQLVRYVQQAKKIKGSTGRVLLRLLEMRLDNIVFRLHMAPTIKAARQLISHGHILVNKKKVTIPSYQCEPKDIITVAPKIISMELVSRFLTEFDKEKSIYDRILKILEFGRKGVTMKLLSKNAKPFGAKRSSLVKKDGLRKGSTSKIQKLKIGTVLNVTIQNRGRKEAEAISYAFGKMIVIHPFFVGKQSLNKTVRVVIYKKSKNNKILYTYPANPFYLRLENLRKLNSLDVAKLFSNSVNQISSKFNKKSSSFRDKKRTNLKNKINTSALILMNASKLLPKNSLDRRKRVIAGQVSSGENNSLNTERVLAPSVFIRIVAAKCLNKSKHNSTKLSTFLTSLKKLNPTFGKDPVAYREKYVYTKTSKVLRLFGTRFYAKILKNKNSKSSVGSERFLTKKSNFAVNKNTNSRSVIKNGLTNEKSLGSDRRELFPSFKLSQIMHSELSVGLSLDTKVKSLPLALKSGLNSSFQNVTSLKNSGDQIYSSQTMNTTENILQTGIFKKYLTMFSKLACLKAQKTVNVDLNNLKKKVLNSFLCESKQLSFKPANMDQFIVLFFQKLSTVLTQKSNTTFTKQNILLIAKNMQTFWLDNSTALESSKDSSIYQNSKEFSNQMFIFLLQLTSVYKTYVKTKKSNPALYSISTKIDNLITNNINFLFLLDKIKTNLQSNFNFIKSLFTSDCLISSILPYFNGSSIYSILNNLDSISFNICKNLLNLTKTSLNFEKLTKIKNNLQSDSASLFQLNQLSQNLVNCQQSIAKVNFAKLINFTMVSLPKAVFLVEYEKIKDFRESIDLSQFLDTVSFNSVQKQKIILVKTVTFLNRKNLIKDSKVYNFKNLIKQILQNQTEILSHLKNSFILTKKFNQLKREDSLNLNQKILKTTLNQKFLLLEYIKSTSTVENLKYFEKTRIKTQISLDILQRKNTLLQSLDLIKDFHLINSSTQWDSVKILLNNHFSVIEKLKGMLTLINFSNSLDWKIKIKTVLTKNFAKIDQILASVNNFWKLFNNKLISDNSLAKENILRNIKMVKNQYSQSLLKNFLDKTDLAIFVKNVLFKTMKNFRFINQLQKIMHITTLKELNLLSDSCVVQMVGEIKQKLSIKGLTQRNNILSKLLLDTKLKKVSWNQRIDLLSLDSFLKTSFLNSSRIKGQKIASQSKDYFWKKVLAVLTPSKISLALKTLKNSNKISSNMYNYLILKLNNLYSSNKTLNLSLNNQYFKSKLNIIFKTLIFISKNLKIHTLMCFNLFTNTVWGTNKISDLSLQNQNELREVVKLVNNQKTTLKNSIKLQKESSSYLTNSANFNQLEKFNSLLQSYIENIYNYVLSKFVSLNLVPSNNLHFINTELNSMTNNIKLFLKLQTFSLEFPKQTNHVTFNSNQNLNLSLKNSILFYLNKDLKTKLFNLLKNKQSFFTDQEYNQLNNTFKKVTASSFSLKLATNFVDNLNQSNSLVENAFNLNLLQKNILKLYNYSYTPAYYNFQNSLNNSFESSSLKLTKIYLSKILNNLKLTVNNSKISNLIGEIDYTEIIHSNYKSKIYQTFTNLALIENYVLCNKDYSFKLNHKQLLQNAKNIYLKDFNQSLKLLIYVTNLDTLKNMKIISDQQYLQFKTNYENIFKLVKKQIVLLNTLNKRKKWNFINYSTYQNLVRSIHKNLTVKITNLLQKINSSTISSKNKIEESLLTSGSFQNSQIGGDSIEVQTIVQQTLEQLVNTSDNVSVLVSNFISKTLLVLPEKYGSSAQELQIENTTARDLIKPLIKETYKRLIAVHKKLELVGPWTADSVLIKTKQKQKTVIIKNFVNNIKISDHVDNTIYNKFMKISLFEIFLKEKTKMLFNNISLNAGFNQTSTNLNKAMLVKIVDNLQFKLQKGFLTKFNNGFVNGQIESNNTGLDLNKYKEFNTFYNLNIQNQTLNAHNNAVQSYNSKFVFQSIFTNLVNIYITQKFDMEFKQIVKFQKIQCIKTLLFHYAFHQTNSRNSFIRIKLAKLLTESLTIKSFDNSLFMNASHIEKLVHFEAYLKTSSPKLPSVASNVSNTMLVQMQRDIQKHKLRKTIVSLENFENFFSDIQSLTFNTVKHSTLLLDVLSRLYDLKNNHIISERKYSLIKQKLKIFSLFLVLNQKLTDLKTKGLINSEKAVELQKQIIQKIIQKMKKSKTFAKFRYSLKSLNYLTKKGSDGAQRNSQRKASQKENYRLSTLVSALTSLHAAGRWSKVTLKQLVKQKVLNTRQEEKLSRVLANQDSKKMQKLRRIITVLLYSRQVLENTRNLNTEKLIKDVIGSALQSFTGPWKRVLANLLSNQKFNYSLNPVQSKLSEDTLNPRSSEKTVSNFEVLNTQTKVTKLLRIYYHQILILRRLKANRTISLIEFEQKFQTILGNIIILLEKGGLEAFKVIYNIKWINVLLKNHLSKNSSKKTKLKSQKKATRRQSPVSTPAFSRIISEFSSKYNLYKNLYFSVYKKSVLKTKIRLFHMYKNNLLTELLYLEKMVTNHQNYSLVGEILNSSRLNYLKKQGIIDTQSKTYKKLNAMLSTSLQRLGKLDRLFTLQNLYLSTGEAKTITEKITYTTTTSEVIPAPEMREVLSNNQLSIPFLKLKQKIIIAYLRFEYKQIEKSLMKQKLFVKILNTKLSQKKQTNAKTKLVSRKKSKTFSAEQFNSFFQQLLNFLDSRYKSAGRNRRNPRINSIIRRLNQKLAFDKTLTKKFGDHLQKFIEKRFGPALPIPPHLELKRWKIKNAKLQSKQKANLKHLILPVGIVHDLAPRRSVGLPILERLIVEYYSRN